MSTDSNTRALEPLLDRPLSARSLIASVLLRSRPPRMSGARCVQWCGLFGVAEGTARVALSRMVERGELRTNDGMYELAGRVGGRRGAQDWSLDPVLTRWKGDWKVAIVPPTPRDAGERTTLRETMRRLRYTALREGVWTRPDNLPRTSAPVEAWKVADEQCAWWSGRPDGDPAVAARELFQIAPWSARAEMLAGRLVDVTGALRRAGDESLADAFVAGAASVAHVRSDPLLPRELAADAFDAGAALRQAYGSYERAFSTALRVWFRSH